MNKKNTLRLAISAMLVAISIVSLYFIRFPLIPSAPFLEYDCADIPVMISALLFGPLTGFITLLCVCIIQALTVSAQSGIIGLLMHLIASSVLIVIPSIIYKSKKSKKALTFGLIIGTLAMTAIMIPLNIVFTGIFLGAGAKTVISMLIPAIIPFNLLKGIINSVVSFAVFTPIYKIFKGGTNGIF